MLVVMASITPPVSTYSYFELERRAAHSKMAKHDLLRYELTPEIKALFAVKVAILLVLSVVLLIVTFGWLIGIFAAILLALTYRALARIPVVAKLGRNIYARFEDKLFSVMQHIRPFTRIIRDVIDGTTHRAAASRDELRHIIEISDEVLSNDERKLLSHALIFPDITVAEVMTKRDDIKSIQKSEFLGPLTLSELHDIGHSRLPVVNGDLDHVVGVLHLRDLLSLNNKSSATAEKVMESKVFYIREDHTLEHALAAFLKSRHHLFVVINKNRETVGLVSLEDVIEALLGREIYDEDDNHSDIHEVANHTATPKNNPSGRVDV